jgi:CRISPR-associated protein Csm2
MNNFQNNRNGNNRQFNNNYNAVTTTSWKDDKNFVAFPKEQITNTITPEGVKYAEKFGTFLGRPYENNKGHLTTSQLRKFFGEVRRQDMKGYNQSEFILLKPKLAYAVGRAKKDGKSKIEDFYLVMTEAIDLVKDQKTFDNFIKMFEAIVAYHKAVEPKEKN